MSEPASASGPGGGGTIPAGTVRSLSCPACGAAIVLRAFAWTQQVACASCGSVLDARDPNLAVLQAASKKTRARTPFIPLGTRGQWRGAPYEVIGFQVVSITVEGVEYAWHEYLLFNPYHGFRFLTQYDGHWNDVVAVHGVVTEPRGTNAVVHRGRTYKHFQSATATTRYVIGEFPWEVRVGDRVTATDYVDPPRMLSAELSGAEITWSHGEYVAGDEVWGAFRLPGSPPPARGVFANQPSPYASSAGIWKTYGMLVVVLLLLTLARVVTAPNATVHDRAYVIARGDSGVVPFTTPSFDLPGGSGNFEVDLSTDIRDSWMYVNYTLIGESTGAAYDFGREIGYYSGYDEDGRWTEGSQEDRARLGNIPGGRYFLRLDVEMPPGAQPVMASMRVRRGVPTFLPVLLALLALTIPPVVLAIRYASFETKRWAESDHPLVTVDTDGDDE